KMVGQAPFTGATLVEYGVAEPEPVLDGTLVPKGERVEWYVAIGGPKRAGSRGYGVMQVPIAEIGALPAERRGSRARGGGEGGAGGGEEGGAAGASGHGCAGGEAGASRADGQRWGAEAAARERAQGQGGAAGVRVAAQAAAGRARCVCGGA